jgi:hypothetical protein
MLVRASPRFPKPTPNLDFVGKIKKNSLQQLHISTHNLSALGKIDPMVWKYIRASNRLIQRWKNVGRNKKNDQGFQCKFRICCMEEMSSLD